MSSYLNKIQTGYAFARCALQYGEGYLPHFGHKVSKVARQALLVCDLIDTYCTGLEIRERLEQRERIPDEDKVRFGIDFLVKGVVLVGLSALFVKGLSKVLIPKIDPSELLQSTNIPKEVLQFNPEGSLSYFTAAWKKTTLEHVVTGVFFFRTVLDLYLARLKSARLPLMNAMLHAGTLYKTAQYRTLEVQHTFTYLMQRIDYSFNLSRYSQFNEFFGALIPKVEANFELNTENLSKQEIIDKIQSIYTYSRDMFQNSSWSRYWMKGKDFEDYYSKVLAPFDPGLALFVNFGDFLYRLFYKIKIATIPPVPVTVRVLHEDQRWQGFKVIDIFQWIPRFWIPAQKVRFSTWVEAELDLPPTPMDNHVTKILKVLSAFFQG